MNDKISLEIVYPEKDTNTFLIKMFDLISKRKNDNSLKDNDQYYETHHIIPRAWFKQKHYKCINDDWNLVDLSFPKHIIVHILLKKYFESINDTNMMNASIAALSILGLKRNKITIFENEIINEKNVS